MEDDCEAQLRGDRKSQCKEPRHQRTTRETYFRETPQDVPSGEEDYGCHDGHLREFCPALSNAWNEDWHSENAQCEASTEHNCEVHEPSESGLLQGYPETCVFDI